MEVQHFFHQDTYTLTYLVWDPETLDAIVIDPAMDYDPSSGSYHCDHNSRVSDFIANTGLKLHYLLETHAHADHISGAYELKKIYPDAKIAISNKISEVQKVFKGVFNLEMATDGSQFDHLLADGDELDAGSLSIKVITTPGHTPACASFLIGDCLFSGDALFMPDFGTGRCDFPAGSATDLYDSVHGKLYNLPDSTKVFVGHDYQPGGRRLEYQTTIRESKSNNIQISLETTKAEFTEFRNERDSVLKAPRLLLPSIQVNILAGKLPEAEPNGLRYLKLPIKNLC